MVYVLDPEEQAELLARLTPTDQYDHQWSCRYVDARSGQHWLAYFPEGSLHARGKRVIRLDPVPEPLTELLRVCLTSPRLDDAVGLAIDLRNEYESWPAITGWLEDNRQAIGPGQLEAFLTRLTILIPLNRRPTLGKDAYQIEADHWHFQSLAKRAQNLLEAKTTQ